jgi:TonB-linked SusC/RagA family outer membrane protein
MYSQQQIEDWRTGKLPSTDWLGAIVNNSSSQTQHNINISGGSQKFQFFLSGGYFNQGGLLSSGMEEGKKYNLRADVGAEIAKGLKFDVNLGLIDNVQNQPSQSVSNIIRNTWRFAPAYPVYSNNAPGYYNHVPNEQNPNPVALIDQNASGYNYQNSRNFQSTFTLDYQIPFVEGLSAKALFAYDNSYFMNKHFTKAFSEYDYDSAAGIQVPDAGFNGPSNLHQSFGEGIRNDLQFQLNYSKSFGKHNLSILALYEELYNQSDGIEGQGNYVIDALDQLSAIDPSTALNTSSYGANSNRSYAGKLNYGYAGKYLLEAGFREEGSSYFSGNRRWGFFPYASAGWVISNESFIKNNLKFINNLKLRASIGKEGDDQGAAASFPAFMEGYNYPGGNSVYGANGSYQGSVFGSNFVRGISFKNSVNPNITWYTSTQTDIGLDLSFWEGKLTFTGDIFRRNRSGLLATPIIAVPGTYGVNLPPENINSDRTEGFEIELGTTGKIGNVTYTINPNMSFARTEWLHYEQSSPLNAQSNYTGQLSHRWTDLVWGYKVIGQFQNYDQMYAAPDQDGAGNKTLLPGDYKYADVNHDGQINSADETVIASGGVKPLIYFATNINLTWKEFDFSLLLQGATMFHHTFQDQLSAPFYFTDSDPVSIYFDRWHQENMLDPNSPWVPGRFPSTGERSSSVPGNTPNSANTYNATYLRIKSLEIGYTFRGVTLKRLQFKALRVFANAYDLYTFTGKGLNFIDPEYSSTRYFGSYEYPITMNVNIGAQLTF